MSDRLIMLSLNLRRCTGRKGRVQRSTNQTKGSQLLTKGTEYYHNNKISYFQNIHKILLHKRNVLKKLHIFIITLQLYQYIKELIEISNQLTKQDIHKMHQIMPFFFIYSEQKSSFHQKYNDNSSKILISFKIEQLLQ